MILTPISLVQLPEQLACYRGQLSNSLALTVLDRITEGLKAARAHGPLAQRHHHDAVRVAAFVGMALRSGPPRVDYSWNGRAARAETEAYVLLHEVAHYQLAAPDRRRRIDFGLGAGPETGNRGGAERAASLFGLAREREEAMASLLGILWEVELKHPALASFLDQNWLEGAGRPSAGRHFETLLEALRRGGFISRQGRPRLRLRREPDAPEELGAAPPPQCSLLCGPA